MEPLGTKALRRSSKLVLAGICALAVVLAARDLGDEAMVSMDGDMPRYLMNGVFLRDVLADLPFGAPLEYASRYFARYPALSLGHHPLLPAAAEVPFFALFGISVTAARLGVLGALVITVICWFSFVRNLYDTATAALATLLFLSMTLELYRVVLSEPYTLCFIMLSLYFMQRYCATGRTRHAVAFTLSAILSAYAKHLAVFVFPVYAFQFLAAFGLRRVLHRTTLLMAAAIVLGLLPLVPLTLKYSQINLMIVAEAMEPGERATGGNFVRVARRLFTGPFALSVPVAALAAVSAIAALLKRDSRVLVFVVWIAAVFAALFLLGVGNDRFVCYWLAAFSGLAAALVQNWPSRRLRGAIALSIVAVAGWQLADLLAATTRPSRAHVRAVEVRGYEDAARFVTTIRRGETVLYSAAVDTGYFVFFLRKHDPRRELVLIRADKLLTTSRMDVLDFERRIGDPSEIVPLLRKYGVGYVVIEEGEYPDGPLRWLQDGVRGAPFALAHRVPFESNDVRLKGKAISVYAVEGPVAPDPDAYLTISVPTMNEDIAVKLVDLHNTPR